MSQAERWQLGGSAPEVYQKHLVPGIFGPWAPILVDLADVKAGQRVLDVACGTGVVSRASASKVGAGGKVVGLDINAGMLSVARAQPAVDGPAIEWQEGDAVDLKFDEEDFDVVFSQLGLQYFSDRVKALSEFRRVLVRGGQSVLLVWRAIEHSPGFEAIAQAMDKHVSSAAGDVMRTPFMFGDTIDQLRSFAKDAGYKSSRVTSDVRMVRFESPEALVQYQIAGSPLAGHMADTDDDTWGAVSSFVSEAMKNYCNDDGVAFPIEGHILIAQK